MKITEKTTGEPRGILRPVDNLGRVVIPKEIRKALNIQAGEFVEIMAYENGVFVRKFEDK